MNNQRGIILTALLALLAAFASACTMAVVDASVLGRPILWKNRDVFDEQQEAYFFEGESYDFITNIYEGDTSRAWAGLNGAGFGIVNTDVYNLDPYGTRGPGDGEVMFNALSKFSTVKEFKHYLDSTNVTGRRSSHCYGVMDAEGNAA